MSSSAHQHIADLLGEVPPGKSIRISKEVMPSLPPEFEQTIWGTPLWIAHPRSVGQYRAKPALHAYEMRNGWDMHRDHFDPEDNPIGHFFVDAPELPIAFFAASIAGYLTWLLLDGRERKKDEEDRNRWVPVLAALAVAAIVGVVAYVLAALVRVSLS